jgi:hypothetical protein
MRSRERVGDKDRVRRIAYLFLAGRFWGAAGLSSSTGGFGCIAGFTLITGSSGFGSTGVPQSTSI